MQAPVDRAREQVSARSPELLAALAVVILAPTVVVVGLLIDLERLARFSLGVIGVGLALVTPTSLAVIWAAAAGLSEVGIGDQTIAGYLTAASLLPFLLLVGLFMRAMPRLDHPVTIWLLFVAVTAVSSPLSPLPRPLLVQRFAGLFDYLGLALLVAAVGGVAKQRVALTMCAAMAAHSIVGVLQYIQRVDGFDAGDGIYRVAGAFGWSTTLGYLLALGLPLAFALILGSAGYERVVATVCAAIMAAALALTFSRTSLVAAAAGCLVVAGLGRLSLRTLTGLGAGAAALAALAAIGGVDVTARFLYGDSVLEFATLNGRTVAWDALFDQSLTLFGHGLFAARDLLDQLLSGAIAPHNVYLESLYDFGVVGATLLVWLHVALLVSLGRLARTPGPLRSIALGGLGAVFASLLHGLTGSELWHFSVGAYFFLIAFLPLSLPILTFSSRFDALGSRMAVWTRRAT
ncbi:MAG TPA: O-antigen ligase family protein [Chloroflexota bacterium]|nr:O-antigen ligase family protein [Chloroflexota bacterium]